MAEERQAVREIKGTKVRLHAAGLAGHARRTIACTFVLALAALLMQCAPGPPLLAQLPVGQTSVFKDCADCPEMVALPEADVALGRFEVTVAGTADERWYAALRGRTLAAFGGGGGGTSAGMRDGDCSRLREEIGLASVSRGLFHDSQVAGHDNQFLGGSTMTRLCFAGKPGSSDSSVYSGG